VAKPSGNRFPLFAFHQSSSKKGQKQELEIQLGPTAALVTLAVIQLLAMLFLTD
jgi:hypothetical protein